MDSPWSSRFVWDMSKCWVLSSLNLDTKIGYRLLVPLSCGSFAYTEVLITCFKLDYPVLGERVIDILLILLIAVGQSLCTIALCLWLSRDNLSVHVYCWPDSVVWRPFHDQLKWLLSFFLDISIGPRCPRCGFSYMSSFLVLGTP